MEKIKEVLSGYRFENYYKEKAEIVLRYELLKVEYDILCQKITYRKIIRKLFERLSIVKIAEVLKMSEDVARYYIKNDIEDIISDSELQINMYKYDKRCEFWDGYKSAAKNVNKVRLIFYIEHDYDFECVKLMLTIPNDADNEKIIKSKNTLKKKEFEIDLEKEEEKNEVYRLKNYQFLAKCEKKLEEEFLEKQNNIINKCVNLLKDFGMSLNYISNILNINNEIIKEYIDNPYIEINENNKVNFYSLGVNLGDEYTKKVIDLREDYLFSHKDN